MPVVQHDLGDDTPRRVVAEIDPTVYANMRAYIKENGTTIKFMVERGIKEFLATRSA
jgi:hypothetical protein